MSKVSSESIDSRSIDFAKTASIDMMALNNKVVNMRQVVKRSKVQVINKLCRNIAALKKKKGTEEQRTQNLRKAERLIEEIDSIKRLKEDKVSKYSLANTISFTDVCKTSLSAGPRAMARLADNALMKKVVSDFRSQHQDWRDLAAYLLVKQTGRRFKTKKQKQRKKLSKSVENIQASETMTKAYIQERFGEDGLKKAELRFERKRKRAPFDKKSQSDHVDEANLEEDINKKNNENDVEDKIPLKEEEESKSDRDSEASSDVSDEESHENESDKDANVEESEISCKKVNISESSPSESVPAHSKTNSNNTLSSNESMTKKTVSSNSFPNPDLKNKPNKILITELKADASGSEESSDDESVVSEASEHDTPEKTNQVASPKKKNECVVKELDLTENGSFEQESSEEASSDEENAHSSTDSQKSDEDSTNLSHSSHRQRKKAKLREIKVPAILTKKPQKAIADPFFAGSDDDDEEDNGPNDFDDALLLEPVDDQSVEASVKGNRSMFYNSHGEDIYRKGVRVSAQGWAGQRGDGRWQRQERGRGSSRGGGFSGQMRGRGRSLGAPRDRHPGSSQGFNRPGVDNPQRSRPQLSTNTPTQISSSEKLHPSWEASKKRKAEQSGIQAFKGSKITFDDDD
ncbi:hypothetical protein EGW08_005479 [Elysia chlorotica]|uniref:Serum response factor-binding protein 1 n=1 Tax=Elysia chlorotica TaxID=188477 RepID=A0A3S1BRA7_ELYCH|nr:hypothetical protein EGW08_005479 [Elysia chlorotica]